MAITDKYIIRRNNVKSVLKTILLEKEISRADISKKLNLNKTSVSSIVDELLSKDLLLELGVGTSSGGRKPILLKFNAAAGFALSFDLGPDYIASLLTDLEGKFVSDNYSAISEPAFDKVYAILEEHIADYLETLRKSTYGIVGITLGIHGIMKDDDLLFSPFYDIDMPQLKKQLMAAFEIPVWLENEGNLAAIGEKNQVPEVNNLISLSVKYGVGAGVILEGDLYTGMTGHVGEIGHMMINIDGKPCACGNNGCLEQYASENKILEAYRKAVGKDKINFITFKTDYLAGKKEAVAVMNDFMKYMSIAVNNLVTTFNPELIIIDSRFTNQIEGIIEGIKSKLLYKGKGKTVIEASRLNREATLVGGSSLTVLNFLELV